MRITTEKTDSQPKDQKIKAVFRFLLVVYLIIILPTFTWQAIWLVPLAVNNEHVIGTQVENYPHDHCTCKYSYKVGDTEFSETGFSCCDIAEGSKIDVYYRSNNPKKSANVEPVRKLLSDLAEIAFAMVPFAILYLVSRSAIRAQDENTVYISR
jgi:hypothetical protein